MAQLLLLPPLSSGFRTSRRYPATRPKSSMVRRWRFLNPIGRHEARTPATPTRHCSIRFVITDREVGNLARASY